MALSDFQVQGADGTTTISFSAVFSSVTKIQSDINAKISSLNAQNQALLTRMAALLQSASADVTQIQAIAAVKDLLAGNPLTQDSTIDASLDAAMQAIADKPASGDPNAPSFADLKAQSDALGAQSDKLQPLLTSSISLMQQLSDHFATTPFFSSADADQAFLAQIVSQEEALAVQVSQAGVPTNVGPLAAQSTLDKFVQLGKDVVIVGAIAAVFYIAWNVFKLARA